MGVGEWIAWFAVLALSLYGCAHLIRKICLLMTRCDRSVCLYRLAIPDSLEALDPLMRCLQTQHAWREDPCRCTLVLLPALDDEESKIAERLLQEDATVIPLTREDMIMFLKDSKE
ncbi:MAG: hypothetical protein E7541_03170 [Ruminococcaceae bacterium]|nr:hypothetical protein [Oscillospiraceae bacterium]